MDGYAAGRYIMRLAVTVSGDPDQPANAERIYCGRN
jgi:hypothetical protein